MSKARDLADLVSTGSLLADGAVSVSEISDLTATAAELNTLDGITASVTELNTLDGITASTADLNNVTNINTNVQTQLDLKAPLASPTFTGTVTADAVTVSGSSPILEFTDTDTGADSRVSANSGNGRLTIEADYNNESANSHIAFTVDGKTVQILDDSGDVSFYEDTGTTVKFFWDASAQSLEINGSSDARDHSLVVSGDDTDNVTSDLQRWKTGLDGGKNLDLTYDVNDNNFDFNAGDRNVTFTTSGNVGIGTTSPNRPLEVSSTSSIGSRIEHTDGGGSYTEFGDTSGSVMIGNSAGAFVVYSGGDASYAGEAEAMRIDSSGNLLVGKTSTSSTTAGGNIFGGLGSFVRDGNTPLSLNRRTNDGEIVSFAAQDSVVGSITALGGRIQIGTADCTLFFNNLSTRIEPRNGDGSLSDGSIDMGASNSRFKDGQFSGTVNAANFNSTSDATLKTNVETLSGSLDAVMSMRGVSFDWIESGNPEIGVIAQEVEEVLPELVNTNDNGIKSVKYGNIVAVLIEAIKEQQEQIDELKAQLNS